MFVYDKLSSAQRAADSYNNSDHTKDWCDRPTEDDGKRAFVKKVPYGYTIFIK